MKQTNKKFNAEIIYLFLAFLSVLPLYAQQGKALHTWTLNSPDGAYNLNIEQVDLGQHKKQLYYSLQYKGKNVVHKSELGILLENQLFESPLGIENDNSEKWCENLDFVKASTHAVDTIWNPLYGERNTVKEGYKAMVLNFSKFGEANTNTEGIHGTSYDKRRSYQLEIEFRAYNEGVAFRYHFPENSNGLFLHITGEQTSFTFEEGTKAYYERWAQGPYSLKPLKNWNDESERPLTLELPNGLYVSLLEAQMIDYARTKFRLSTDKANTLVASIYDNVDAIPPFSTSWRVIMAAQKPTELLQNNDLVLNLNAPNEITNTSWIKPGKAIRSGLTTKEALACVDFAAQHGMQYVHLDAGWYGPEVRMDSKATGVAPGRDLDMQHLINYAADKGIGVFIYVNQRALLGDLDELFGLYQKWGIKGIKFGFVQIGSNRWSDWLHKAVKKAAQYHLMVDIHDEYRPTGFSRTYPNLLSQEGIRGNEEMPDATHNTILPFTRYLAGAGDYTICYYNNRIKTTHAHQLALSVVNYSPLQLLYWYDNPSMYKGEPEIEFFDKVKTVWDDTRILKGEIGKYIATARRSGTEWFVGVLSNNDARNLDVSLSFLEANQTYVLSAYTDKDEVKTKTKVAVDRFLVDSKDILNMQLKASGGAAFHLRPATASDKKLYKSLTKRLL